MHIHIVMLIYQLLCVYIYYICMLVFEETPAHRTVISCLAASARENDPILEGSHKTEEWESCSAIAFGQLCS